MVRIALGQLNTTVGDLDGNVARMADWTARATQEGADVVLFPELAITGYPPEDLVLRPEFVEDNLAAVQRLAKETAASLVMDIYTDDSIMAESKRLGYPQKILDKEASVGRLQRESFRRAVQAGVLACNRSKNA